MRTLRPFVLLLFAFGILLVATEPESALAHTKVHPGALALVDTARVADAPTAPSPAGFTLVLAVVVVSAVLLLASRQTAVRGPVVERDRSPVDRRWLDAFARRGPPATFL